MKLAHSVGTVVRQAVRQVLTTMHHDPAGRAILHAGGMVRFTTVSDLAYDPIRTMLQASETSTRRRK